MGMHDGGELNFTKRSKSYVTKTRTHVSKNKSEIQVIKILSFLWLMTRYKHRHL